MCIRDRFNNGFISKIKLSVFESMKSFFTRDLVSNLLLSELYSIFFKSTERTWSKNFGRALYEKHFKSMSRCFIFSSMEKHIFFIFFDIII